MTSRGGPRRLAATIALLLTSILLLAACGDSDDETTVEETNAETTTSTTESDDRGDAGGLLYMADLAKALAARGDAPSVADAIDQSNGSAEFAELVGETRDGFQAIADELAAAEPPEEIAAEHGDLEAAAIGAAEAIDPVIAAAEADDQAALQAEQASLDGALSGFSAAVTALLEATEAAGFPPLPQYNPAEG